MKYQTLFDAKSTMMNSELNEARSRIADILGETAEPLEVLQRVEEHRLFWRPLKPRVILLAESHVYTRPEELLRTLRAMPEFPASMPKGFVRLVYALGYGEDTLLDEPITLRKNSGSPQYWTIAKCKCKRRDLTRKEQTGRAFSVHHPFCAAPHTARKWLLSLPNRDFAGFALALPNSSLRRCDRSCGCHEIVSF
jgi:hypothetical protein